MLVRVRLFAVLRERARASELELELPAQARVQDALDELAELTAGVPVVMSVNQEYASPEARLHSGDELALIPPVSGGATGTASCHITREPLSLDALVSQVRDPRAGAIVTFTGVTREVDELHYEAYEPMAERKLGDLVAASVERHGLCAAAAAHRVGRVPLSESSVAVAVSAAHRAEAFAAAREIIDELKASVPIWKQEAGEWARGTSPS